MATTATPGNVIREELWSTEVQKELEELLMAQGIVDFVSDFPDGDELTIPKFGTLSARDYEEKQDVIFDDMTVGEFKLSIDKYYQSNTYITDKLKDDSFYISQIEAHYPEHMIRALMERMENDIFLLHKEQTTNDANAINGRAHRYVASGTNSAIKIDDVAKAKLALDKANVSKNGRMAIVDPQVAYQLINIDNVIRQDVYGPNAALKEGFGGTSFIGRYLGFDFYESNMLDEATALDHDAGGSLIANMFIGEDTFKGAVRRMPSIEFNRNANKQRDEYISTMRFGLGLYRPESLVTILTGAVS